MKVHMPQLNTHLNLQIMGFFHAVSTEAIRSHQHADIPSYFVPCSVSALAPAQPPYSKQEAKVRLQLL